MVEVVRDPLIEDSNSNTGRWMVVIYNNATNSFEEVIEILLIATGCDLEEAHLETWEADHYGKAPVHFGTREVCERIAVIVSSIGVKTEVVPEWEE